MSLADHFDRVFVLNLPHRTDRRQRVERELADLGVKIEPGRVEIVAATRPDSADGFMSPGRRGVFLSHAGLARRALDEGLDRVLVLEDDVSFTPAMREHGEAMLQTLFERTWHVAFLGHLSVEASPEKLEELYEGPPGWVNLPGPRIGAHAYALHRDVLPALVDYMGKVETRPFGHPEGAKFGADATFNMFGDLHPQFEILASRPNLATQAGSASDLAPRWFDRVPILKQAARTARAMRDRRAG